jgi:riboflavin synthase
MFSGIVEDMGIVTQVDHQKDKSVITMQVQKYVDTVAMGDSISINGVCLTVVRILKDNFVFEAMPETLRLTNLKKIAAGDYVNVERAITAATRIGGHFVQGHIDGTSTIELIEQDGCSLKIWFKKLASYKDCFIPKGYIAIDGMSLTLVDITPELFSICFIPHTQSVTVVQKYQIGTQVNVEIDHIVKTVALLLKQREDEYGRHH